MSNRPRKINACVEVEEDVVVSRILLDSNYDGHKARLVVKSSGRLAIRGNVHSDTSEMCSYPSMVPSASMVPTSPTPLTSAAPSVLPSVIPTPEPSSPPPSASPSKIRYSHVCSGVAWNEAQETCLPWHRDASWSTGSHPNIGDLAEVSSPEEYLVSCVTIELVRQRLRLLCQVSWEIPSSERDLGGGW